MKTIKVSVKDGKPVLTTEGFSGDSCFKATKQLEDALGGSVESSERTNFDSEEGEKEYESH